MAPVSIELILAASRHNEPLASWHIGLYCREVIVVAAGEVFL
jgi:hypothetical protein